MYDVDITNCVLSRSLTTRMLLLDSPTNKYRLQNERKRIALTLIADRIKYKRELM